MTEPQYLTQDELVALTERQTTNGQIAWLRDNGWRFAISATGKARVAREYWRLRMVTGGKVKQDAPEPDFSGFGQAEAA